MRDYTIDVMRGMPQLTYLMVSVDDNGDGDFDDDVDSNVTTTEAIALATLRHTLGTEPRYK